MTPLGKIAALASTTAGSAAAASLIWIAVHKSPHTGASQPKVHEQTAEGDKVIACVGSDSVLRRSDDDACPAGQRRIALDRPETKVFDCDDCDTWGSSVPARPIRSDDALADLDGRLNKLERSALFTVVDKQGGPILAVAPERVLAYNANKIPVAAIRATEAGGEFMGRSSDGALMAVMGASAGTDGVRVSEGGVTRLTVGRQPAGNYSLRVPTLKTSGVDVIAGIGQSRAGPGALILGDLTGHVRTSMTVVDGKGLIGVYNSAGAGVLSLTEGASGDGLLAIGDATSEPMVKMGVNQGRYGVVLAGPRAGFPLVPRSGLPGSYFLGCAGGEACKP